MRAVDTGLLRQGLIDQILPPTLIDKVSHAELLFLLHASIMLHNISIDHWVFEQILVMANNLLKCEASSILLANPDSREMLIAISTALQKEFYLGRTIPLDKGLSGWVYLQDRPAVVDNIETDERFDIEIDQRVNFEPRCILAIPLRANGKPIGVMEFFNKQGNNFSKTDIQIMTLLANIIAISLNTALRIEK
jgi:GAF domain-containing protein